MTTLPIVTVVGYSNAGKTRCLVALITHLTQRGYRVATAKHCHDGFALDVAGKDTWQHKQAGAVTTLMSNGTAVGVVADSQPDLALEELCSKYVHVADIMLAEGYSWEPHPKILVTSKARIEEERVRADDQVIALVGTTRVDSPLAFFTFEELKELALLLERMYLL